MTMSYVTEATTLPKLFTVPACTQRGGGDGDGDGGEL